MREWIESWSERTLGVVIALVVGTIGFGLGLGVASDSPEPPSAPESGSECMAAVVAADGLIDALLASSQAGRDIDAIEDDADALREALVRLELAADSIEPAGSTYYFIRGECLGLDEIEETTTTTEDPDD